MFVPYTSVTQPGARELTELYKAEHKVFFLYVLPNLIFTVITPRRLTVYVINSPINFIKLQVLYLFANIPNLNVTATCA
jgi:hypothetical protein